MAWLRWARQDSRRSSGQWLRLLHAPHGCHKPGTAWAGDRPVLRLFALAEQVATGCGLHRAALQHHRHHFRNHITGTAHDDGVANAYILAADFVFVVQGGIGDRHTTDKHRLQACHRGDGTGAANLFFDGFHQGQCLFGRKLVGNGPARRARDKAQFFLQARLFTL
jgi:hypothetical protein